MMEASGAAWTMTKNSNAVWWIRRTPAWLEQWRRPLARLEQQRRTLAGRVHRRLSVVSNQSCMSSSYASQDWGSGREVERWNQRKKWGERPVAMDQAWWDLGFDLVRSGWESKEEVSLPLQEEPKVEVGRVVRTDELELVRSWFWCVLYKKLDYEVGVIMVILWAQEQIRLIVYVRFVHRAHNVRSRFDIGGPR
jgi:hypothetical protein